MYVCVFFHRKCFNDLAWSVFASLEEDQYIFDAKGVVEECGKYFIQGKTRRKLSPGSLLFLLGNTLHAGSKFEGNEEALLKKLEGSDLPRYRGRVGDLKLFFDVDGKLPGQMAGGSSSEQLWCFESGNRYGKRAGFTDDKSVEKHLIICDENDACDVNEACFAELNDV